MKKYLILLILLFMITPAWGASLYVKNGGSDAGDCTSSGSPCSTLAYANSQASSGDTIFLDNASTWTGSGNVLVTVAGVIYDGETWGAGTNAVIQSTGTATGGVILVNVDSVTLKGIDVDMNDQNAGGIYIGYVSSEATVSNITIQRVKVHDSAGSGYAYGIYIGGYGGNKAVENVTITDSTIYNTQHEGIAIYPSWGQEGNSATNVTVRNCIIHDTGITGGVTWGDGIHIVNELNDIYIEFNTIYDCPVGMRYGNSSDAYVGDPHNINIRYNIVYNCTYGIGMNFGSGGHNSSANVYGNLLYENQYGFNIGGTHSGSTFNYYNNTVDKNCLLLCERCICC